MAKSAFLRRRLRFQGSMREFYGEFFSLKDAIKSDLTRKSKIVNRKLKAWNFGNSAIKPVT